MTTIHVVSVSGGKDSTATALICLERHDRDAVRLVFADTGNEHPITLEYLDYLRGRLNHPIDVVRASFVDEIAHKRQYVLTMWPEKGVAADVCERAAATLLPTGNPFLDLCLWKGRFPSRKAQFCTQELKRYPLDGYTTAIIMSGHEVESWQGVRADESRQRKDAKERDQSAEGWWVNRPIVAWTAQQTVDFVVSRGMELNPLYSKGFKRVGCAPCINSSKEDVSLWARHFNEVIVRLREWERCVALASKPGAASFFPAPEDGRADRQGRNIDEYVSWSMTTRGGQQLDLMKVGAPAECSSIYGLCE
jgi:3'-phosphoadenosine 5'-phosphosulfate sulfotransferase (PAPS reductase)/FAD synthetase